MQREEEQLQAALAASLNELSEDDRQLQEAIRLSELEAIQGNADHDDDDGDDQYEEEEEEDSDVPARPAAAYALRRTGESALRPPPPGGSLSRQDQLKERAERLKRRFEQDGEAESHDQFTDNKVRRFNGTSPRSESPSSVTPPPSTRRGQDASSFEETAQSPSARVSMASSAHSKVNLSNGNTALQDPEMAFPRGALRITRTPGRRQSKNTISLPELIVKDQLVSGCVFAFFIAQDELFRHLPFSKKHDDPPIYIGRDPNLDPVARKLAKLAPGEKITLKQVHRVGASASEAYVDSYGRNFNTFYAWCPGSSHSKVMALVYPKFLRIVITSCNMMSIDTVLGDNHWYIHDLPRRPRRSTSKHSGFEADFLDHLYALNVPEAFLERVRGNFDFSGVAVSLVTSVPGTFSGSHASNHGLLRLRSVVKDYGLKLPFREARRQLELEVCAATIGNLNARWLDGFFDCALGRKRLSPGAPDDDIAVPRMRIVYPTVQDIKRCYAESQEAASNIGCHTRPWDKTDEAIRKLFHHYRSTDDKRLFHQKLIVALDTTEPGALPYYIYIGSANLSQSAWGSLETDNRGNSETSDTKVTKITNYECGVVIPGSVLMTLLEPGTKDWKTAVFTYVRPAEPYNLKTEKPWNDPRWVTGGSSRAAPTFSESEYGLDAETLAALGGDASYTFG